MRIAFFSCQEFIAGFYAAHRDLAAQDVDLVVCLGDYIYEQAFASTGSTNAPVRDGRLGRRRRGADPGRVPPQVLALPLDPNLREVRRQFALVGDWDDHEVEDNYAGDLPGGAAKSRRVPFAERRANGYRAWFEHMPRGLRSQPKIYGSLPWAAPSSFSTRASTAATSRQPDETPRSSEPCPPTTTDDPSRTLLGSEAEGVAEGRPRAPAARAGR